MNSVFVCVREGGKRIERERLSEIKGQRKTCRKRGSEAYIYIERENR